MLDALAGSRVLADAVSHGGQLIACTLMTASGAIVICESAAQPAVRRDEFPVDWTTRNGIYARHAAKAWAETSPATQWMGVEVGAVRMLIVPVGEFLLVAMAAAALPWGRLRALAGRTAAQFPAALADSSAPA